MYHYARFRTTTDLAERRPPPPRGLVHVFFPTCRGNCFSLSPDAYPAYLALFGCFLQAGKFSRRLGKWSSDVLLAVFRAGREFNQKHRLTDKVSAALAGSGVTAPVACVGRFGF